MGVDQLYQLVFTQLIQDATRLRADELALLQKLRADRSLRRLPAIEHISAGERVSDWVAQRVGSWRFVIIQSIMLTAWIAVNVTAYFRHWDPYPFILMNLALSFQAAYTAPIIMMAQNRQADRDRQAATSDYQINIKSELEIELLHQKIDQLRETEILQLIEIVGRLQDEIIKTKIEQCDK